jgi:hypothetical protein
LIVEDKTEFREDFARMVKAAENPSLAGTAEILAEGRARRDGPPVDMSLADLAPALA